MSYFPYLPTPGQKPFLLHLPQEISAEILSYLPRQDLISTCLVSRYMLIVSQPLLYGAPDLKDNDKEIQPSIELLLQTLLSPGGDTLASYVHSLSMCWDQWNQCHIEDVTAGKRKHPRDIPGLAAAGMRLGIYDHLDIRDAQMAVLLDILPQLNILNIDLKSWTDAPFSEFIKPHNVSVSTDALPPGLRQLREFHCGCTRSHSGVDPEILLTFLSLPCIRKVDVAITKLSRLDFDAGAAAAGTSTVTDLRLQQADRCKDRASLHSPLFLTCILKIPVALTHLALTFIKPPGEMHIRDALQHLQGTLQSLDLRIPDLTPPLGSFQGWASLTSLTCSLVVLLGSESQPNPPCLVDMLPSSLRELQILRHAHWTFANGPERDWSLEAEVDQEMDVVRRKKAVVPLLQKMAVVLRREVRKGTTGPRRERLVQHRLRVACAAAGVNFCGAHWDNGW